jgi:hypothetical protein
MGYDDGNHTETTFSSIKKGSDKYEGDEDTVHSDISIDRKCIEDELEQLKRTL